MKSAYELAMARFGDEPVSHLTDEQKTRIAEVERRYEAKRAETDIMHQQRLRDASGDVQRITQLNEDLTVERASLRSRCERDKDRIRNES